jgi:thiamine biosynthesis lipoprotein
LRRFTRTTRALGTEVCITALHERSAVADRALDAAFAELELVESLMSLYREDSQVCRLNREGKLADPHPYLNEVLTFALNLSQRSDGAFDVTVQPLWSLYRDAAARGCLPDPQSVAAALQHVDWRKVHCDHEGVSLPAGAAITLNGIAQGFAADRVAASLARHGVAHALIETGELGALGHDASSKPWKVGVQHPRAPEAYAALAELNGRFLATSGDYQTAFTSDFRKNHLLHPATGRSPQHYSSVSIAAPTAMEADALSTAVFMLEPSRALTLLSSFAHVDALLIHKDGRIQATQHFPFAS